MPQEQTHAKCGCENCGGRIEFPVEAAGQKVDCPHCQFPTVLTAPAAPAASPRRAGRNILIVEALLVLAAAGAAVWWFKRQGAPISPEAAPAASAAFPPTFPVVATKSAPPPPPPAPDLWHGLMAGPVTLEKSGNGNLVYAVGLLRNASDHQRFGVKAHVNLFDASGAKVGAATDYIESLDAGKQWHFRALVTDRRAVKAALSDVTED